MLRPQVSGSASTQICQWLLALQTQFSVNFQSVQIFPRTRGRHIFAALYISELKLEVHLLIFFPKTQKYDKMRTFDKIGGGEADVYILMLFSILIVQ